MRATALLAFALVAAAPAGTPSVTAGIDAWQRGKYAAAIANWRPLAERGDADASFNLGQAYRLGRGVKLNLAAAQTWLERAARKGHVDAQTTLGLLLFDSGDRAGGLRWLKLAAEQGEPRALLVAGTALFNGDGIAPDPVLAYAYVSRAAAQGLAPAKETLAEMDRALPLEQRMKGVEMALTMANERKSVPPGTAAAAAPAQKPRSQAAAQGGTWRVQLGAFGKPASADALFARLAASGLLAGKQKFLVSAGAVTRLQAGPFASRAAAVDACRTLSARGQACFPVAPR